LAHNPEYTATSELFARVSQTPAVQSLAQRLEKGGVLSCAGISAAAQPFLTALLHRLFPQRPLVLVTDGLKAQESLQQDLTTWLGFMGEARNPKPDTASAPPPIAPQAPPPFSLARGDQPLFYPAWEILPNDARLPHADVISERLETLVALAGALRVGQRQATGQHHAPLMVTSVAALLQRTFPREVLSERTRALARGEGINPLDLTDWLEAQGYEPEARVTQKGELSLRGGILDVYPLTSPWPVRLEFFGDELESLRYFDPLTQISREEVAAVTIPPAGELGLLKKAEGQNLGTLLDYLPPETVLLLCEPERLAECADDYARQVPEGDAFFIPWETLQAQAGQRGITRLEVTEAEPGWLALGADELGSDAPAPLRMNLDAGQCVSPALPSELERRRRAGETPCPTLKPGEIRESKRESLVPGSPPDSLPEGQGEGQAGSDSSTALQPIGGGGAPLFASLEAFRPLPERAPEPQIAEMQRREFFAQLHRWLRQGYVVHVFCNNDGERQRFTEIWQEYGLPIAGQASRLPSSPNGTTSPGARDAATREGQEEDRRGACPTLHIGALARGFLCDPAKVVVVTDAEIFGRYKVQRPRRLKSSHAQATRSALDIDFTELEEGDYVVHLQHGIGQYRGLQVLPIGSGTKPTEGTGASANAGQECLVIEYAPGDPAQAPPKLYVPVTEAHLVSKYVGTGKARPPLNRLGGTRWAQAKAQAERAVRDVASDLLTIQAARDSQAGHAFPPDAPWQREFEGAFIYEETPDQMTAIVQTKGDMERPKPMDRLICGDVGFGKTEVGIRAAFKAVMGGKQVAVLVPTTVLAQQHFNTFRERMADYPIRIELLSRFRTRRAQEIVVQELATGAVDIVIGTHRLLQADIAFKDLGLVVIDEEQRFGVMHKEKFKMLRQLVDVLTLSATPIPRTLYLALTGARDMSTIQTPPHDRLPVETIVTAYDERVIRDVIQRELNRGGQVFFLHNRVMTIEAMAQKLRALLPQARVIVGHGQMHSDDLEEVMTKFVNGEADVLLSTTIIESGLDIPNANTIIIDRADRFGLSDLYQLRGRVGRYKHQAYAYLLLPRHGGLLTEVRKRLSAIKQYATLGSGFKIAMRDLEIRGAGNLLGSEQSGHITAVGFELYCQLLKQSVSALKGEKVKPRVEVQVGLDFLALSPLGDSPPSAVRSPRSSVLNSAEDEPGTTDAGSRATHHASRITQSPLTSAYIPFQYISDSRQRIEVYRKLAQATDKTVLRELETELRDRFGALPPALGLLLLVAELKVLASERGITAIEVKEDKLMLTRHNDYIMVGSKFPRLTAKTAPARLKEIKKLLMAL
jgi:transcription-repair coupling factor (superfamily II helicase)